MTTMKSRDLTTLLRPYGRTSLRGLLARYTVTRPVRRKVKARV